MPVNMDQATCSGTEYLSSQVTVQASHTSLVFEDVDNNSQ